LWEEWGDWELANQTVFCVLTSKKKKKSYWEKKKKREERRGKKFVKKRGDLPTAANIGGAVGQARRRGRVGHRNFLQKNPAVWGPRQTI